MNDDLNVSIYGKGFSDVNTCAYTESAGLCCNDEPYSKYASATEASKELCVCDDTVRTHTTTKDIILNTSHIGDYVQETITANGLHVNWDTVNHKYEIEWDLCTNPTDKDDIPIYKASRKFKRITIK